MPLLQDPFLGGSYGWTTGESGWGSPMNENLLRFSILHNRRIDSIEATLPLSPSDGDAHFITADNQLYYRVGGQWYFTSVPVGFELIEKVTEKHYRFNGTSIEEIDTVEELAENKADIVDSVTTVPTFADLATTTATVGQVVYLKEYNSGTGLGGGELLAKAGSITPNNVITFASATAGVYFQRINYSVVDAEMAGIAGDAVTDDFTKLQASLTAAAGGRWYLNRHCRMTVLQFGGLMVPSNTVVEFGPSGKIELLAHNASNYGVLQLYNVDNVEIINPVIDGRRDLNSAVSGEFGMGIYVRGTGGKVKITKPVTMNCWGDGIYVGATPEKNFCDDVEINGHYADNCRRQGCSVVSVKRLIINDPVWDNTNGTAPAAGLDIEPNSNSNELQFIRINNPKTSGNVGAGIKLYLNSLVGATEKVIDIVINGHRDTGSKCGYEEDRLTFGANKVLGQIVNNEPLYENSDNQGIVLNERAAGTIRTVINRPTIVDWNRSGQTATKYAAAISILRDTGATTTEAIGGVSVINPTIKLVNSTATALFYANDVVNANNIADVAIVDPLYVGVTTRTSVFPKNAFIFTDSFKSNVRTISSSATLTYATYCPYIYHDRVTTTSAIALDSSIPYGAPPIIIENTNSGRVRVVPPSGGSFIGGAANQYYESGASAGHKIIVTPMGGDLWRVDGLFGTWTLTGP